MTDKNRTFIFQREGDEKGESVTIHIDKTVKDLLDIYLDRMNLKDSFNDLAFMVGAYPLKKTKYINTQIKSLRFLKPNIVIKVRTVDTKMGGIFK